jgi:hypothetical protein
MKNIFKMYRESRDRRLRMFCIRVASKQRDVNRDTICLAEDIFVYIKTGSKTWTD